jgi:hypothetical protein
MECLYSPLSQYPAYDALQIAGLWAGCRDRMIRGWSAAIQNLQVPSPLNCCLGNQVFHFLKGNEPGATARHQYSITSKQFERELEQPPIALEGFGHGSAVAGKFRWIEYHDIELPPGCGKVSQMSEHIGTLERHVGKFIRCGVTTGQFQGHLRSIDSKHFCCPGFRSVQPETARVAERIENPLTDTEFRDLKPVVALVEVIPGFLTLREIDQYPQTVLGNGQIGRWRLAPERSIVEFNPSSFPMPFSVRR